MPALPSRRQFIASTGTAGAVLATAAPAPAADEPVVLVKAGKPVATIVVEGRPPLPKGKKEPVANASTEYGAALLLAEWLKKITDATIPVAEKAPAEGMVIYVGRAAVMAGLKLDDVASPSKEGVRIVAGENRVLIGGQSEPATAKAVCRFLEELGCRYFMDGPLGEVFPRTTDLAVKPVTITEKPGLLYRNPKGPSWMGGYWKAWNGAGGEEFHHAHSWGRYIPKGLFAEHPEYFAQGADGRRKNGDWLCTSNPGARAVFADNVIAAIKAGAKNPSISPPDGRGYCQCDTCKAQDDPKLVEPSSGTVSVSTRYADFFDDVAKRVAKVYPDSVLSFYVYADYTQPPKRAEKLAKNLCAVIAPIRYCRLHAIGDENCPSRKQQLEMIDGWAKVAHRLGYYNYMYNLADATLPMFKYTPCKIEFPYLAKKGLDFMTIEVLSNWYIYGPQIYLSLRMAYDPTLDTAKLMEDYYAKFYGPAAKSMKEYWETIDAATAKLGNHSGGFYGLAAAYDVQTIFACVLTLRAAAKEAKDNSAFAERVAMHADGFRNLEDYFAICMAMAKGDFVAAKKTYDQMVKRIGELVAKKQANGEYGTAYLKRFLLRTLEGGAIATSAPNKLVSVLPDKWKFRTDDSADGDAKFEAAALDDSKWKLAATHSATLSQQGLSENTVLWYRTKFTAPANTDRLALVFTEVDGIVSVYVNGKELPAEPVLAVPPKKGAKAPPAGVPRRAPFRVILRDVVKPGENVIAVRCDNRKISELFLGGILRPVMLVDWVAKPD
ncbi:MAG: DUF4838 domain-containing protein [Planctomycetes bacterium]|nr:DUF4838 domain-containing protein [Planctomycetota bacterium]